MNMFSFNFVAGNNLFLYTNGLCDKYFKNILLMLYFFSIATMIKTELLISNSKI